MILLLKWIVLDVLKLYKNFFAWNASKILISTFTFLLGIVLSLPFFIIAILIAVFSNIEWMQVVSSLLTGQGMIANIIFEYPFVFWSVAIFFVLGIIAIIFWMSYSILLINKLNFNYLKDKTDILFKKTEYYNFKRIWVYFKLLCLNSLIILGIWISFLIIMFIFTLLFWWANEVKESLWGSEVTFFSILSFIVFMCFVLISFYAIYRLLFSFIILIEDKKYNSAIYYIKKSLKVTSSKKSLFRFLVVMFALIIVSMPVWYTWEYLENKYYGLENYSKYIMLGDESKENLKSDDGWYYFINLELEYTGVSEEEINSNIKYYYFMQRLYFIFSFLVIYWLTHMVLVSFYVRELKNSKKISSGNMFMGLKKIFKFKK